MTPNGLPNVLDGADSFGLAVFVTPALLLVLVVALSPRLALALAARRER